MSKLKADLVIKDCSEILTCKENSKDLVGLELDKWIAIANETIIAIGSREEIDYIVDYNDATIIDGNGKVVLPGFVDSHTHLVFGGSRVDEYIANLTIDDKEKIKAMGIKTGIYASIDMTKEIEETLLFEESLGKLNKMLETGTTTVEIKSGYGLDLDTELKQLRVINKLDKNSCVDVNSTFLGAHGWPLNQTKGDYIEFLIKESIPFVGENKLATACDIWVDDGYYTTKEAERILKTARDYGMEPKMHTDCYSYIGGSDLVVEMGMLSGDHLNYIPLESIKKMAKAKIPGVLLPGTDFSVNHPKPFNPRPMIEEGMIIALATNLNPGNWVESMQFIIALACRKHRMSPEEAIRAATFGGAYALGLDKDRGSLEVGKLADIQIWDTDYYGNVAYKLGGNLVEKVIKRGKIVVDR